MEDVSYDIQTPGLIESKYLINDLSFKGAKVFHRKTQGMLDF